MLLLLMVVGLVTLVWWGVATAIRAAVSNPGLAVQTGGFLFRRLLK